MASRRVFAASGALVLLSLIATGGDAVQPLGDGLVLIGQVTVTHTNGVRFDCRTSGFADVHLVNAQADGLILTTKDCGSNPVTVIPDGDPGERTMLSWQASGSFASGYTLTAPQTTTTEGGGSIGALLPGHTSVPFDAKVVTRIDGVSQVWEATGSLMAMHPDLGICPLLC